MDTEFLSSLLLKVKEGKLEPDEALLKLRDLPYEDLGFAKVDHHRNIRNGFSEVIFCQGKTPQQVKEIFAALAKKNRNVLATRASLEMFSLVSEEIPGAQYHELARCITLMPSETKNGSEDFALVLSAGTADLPVAEEAAVTLEVMGHRVERLYDVGVAGIHRLLYHQGKVRQASVLIVVAGMEGALASVVGGLTDKPIVAVPTSIGYGASFGGLAALLAMLNSCASGVGVVNIDNGFGAGALAASILNLRGD